MEKSVLYCIIEDFDCRNKALNLIDEKFFYDERAREFFKQIYNCYTENDTIDMILVTTWMRRNKSLKIVTLDYIIEIGEECSRLNIHNFDVHINQLIRRRKTDLVIQLLQQQHETIVQDENFIEEQITTLQTKLTAINEFCSLQPLKPANIEESKKDILRNIENNRHSFNWKYQDIDKVSGINRGCLYTLAGRPGSGKTTFSMNVLYKNKMDNPDLNVAFLSFEMSSSQLIERFCQIHEKTNAKFIERSVGDVERSIDGISDLDIDIYDLTTKNELSIREITERNEYDIVVIDFLQNIKSSKNFTAERLKFNYLVDYINTTRRISDTSIILLSQVNRNVDERRPYLRDLKETASIEELSDLVMFLYSRNDIFANENKEKIRYIEAIINKNRYGDITREDQIILSFNKSNMNFYCTTN